MDTMIEKSASVPQWWFLSHSYDELVARLVERGFTPDPYGYDRRLAGTIISDWEDDTQAHITFIQRYYERNT
jgi:hypothetical protein